MLQKLPYIRRSLTRRLILWVGLILLGSISIWAYANIKYHKKNATDHMIEETDRLSNTIKLGTHYAMTLNSRDDINQIIGNIGKLQQIQEHKNFQQGGADQILQRQGRGGDRSGHQRRSLLCLSPGGAAPGNHPPFGANARV